MFTKNLNFKINRRILFILIICLPGLLLLFQACQRDLGANPIEAITHTTGTWSLRLLMASLAITPISRILSVPSLIDYRRILGLAAFGYASAHLSTYLFLDLNCNLESIVEDIMERPYITVGFATFMCLLVLAATSPRAIARKIGKQWKSIHRLVYFAGFGSVIHYLWLTKADTATPLAYGGLLTILLGERAFRWVRRQRLRNNRNKSASA